VFRRPPARLPRFRPGGGSGECFTPIYSHSPRPYPYPYVLYARPPTGRTWLLQSMWICTRWRYYLRPVVWSLSVRLCSPRTTTDHHGRSWGPVKRLEKTKRKRLVGGGWEKKDKKNNIDQKQKKTKNTMHSMGYRPEEVTPPEQTSTNSTQCTGPINLHPLLHERIGKCK